MASFSDKPRAKGSLDGLAHRVLATGSIRYVVLAKDDDVQADADPEVFLRVAGRGRIAWPGRSGRDRSGAALLLPPRAKLSITGHLRALRVLLPGLIVSRPTGPLSEVLVGLLCSRAWRSDVRIAEGALSLVRLLIEEELAGSDRSR